MSTRPTAFRRPKFEMGDLVYRLTVVFPSWAGAFVLLYVLVTYGLTALNVYFR